MGTAPRRCSATEAIDINDILGKVVEDATKLVSTTTECIKKRFDSFSSNEVLNAFQVMYAPRYWPNNKDKLAK